MKITILSRRKKVESRKKKVERRIKYLLSTFYLLLSSILLLGVNITLMAQSEYPGIFGKINFDDVNPLWDAYGETLAFERIYKSRPVEYGIFIFEPFGDRYVTKLAPKGQDDSSHNSFFRWIDINKNINTKPYIHNYEYIYVKNSELYAGKAILKKIFNKEKGIYIPSGKADINERIFISNENGENGYPSYSNENKKVAFTSGINGVNHIYMKQYKDMSSFDGKKLSAGNSLDTMPNWSPDGKNLVYASRASKSNMEIFVIKDALSENRKILQLTNSELDKTIPIWSPDGKMIAFYSLRVNNSDKENKVFDLCVIDAENGKEIARVEFVHRQERRGPVWVRMPDYLGNIKNWLYFISGDYNGIKALELEEGKIYGILEGVKVEGLKGYAYGNITDLDCIYVGGGTEKGVRIAYSALSENHQKRIYCAICETMKDGFIIKKEASKFK